MPDSLPEILFQEQAKGTQFSSIVETLKRQKSDLLSDVEFLDEEQRQAAINQKVSS